MTNGTNFLATKSNLRDFRIAEFWVQKRSHCHTLYDRDELFVLVKRWFLLTNEIVTLFRTLRLGSRYYFTTFKQKVFNQVC